MTRSTFACALLLTLGLSFPLTAQEVTADKAAKIEKLWAITGLAKQIESATAAGLASMENQLLRPGTPEAQLTKIRAALAEVKALTTKSLGLEGLKPKLLAAYDKAYTAEELDRVLKALDNPDASLFFTKSPALAGELGKANAEAAQALQPQIMGLIQKAMQP
jgi:hypothetical protein